MNYLQLCFSCTLCVYFPLQTLAWSSEMEKPIDYFIDKLLKSDKFDQLASKIAEKAADRLVKKIQNNNATNAGSVTPKSVPVYRVSKNETKETKKRKETEKRSSENTNHIGDDIKPLIGKSSPFNELSLKYVKLIETNRQKERGQVRSKTKDKDGKGSTTTKGEKRVTTKKRYDKIKERGSDTRIKEEKEKPRKSKKITKPKRSRQTTPITTKVTKDENTNEKRSKEGTFESFEFDALNATVVLDSREVRYTRIGTDFEETTKDYEKKSQNKANFAAKHDDTNLTNVKTKRIISRENERYYVFASSSEYDDVYLQDFSS